MSELNKTNNTIISLNKRMYKLVGIQQQVLKALQGTSRALKEQKTSAQETSKEMYSLAKAAEVTKKANDGLLTGLAKASENSKLWTITSRVLSGTGLWKLQNYVRAAGQAINLYNESNEKAVKATNDSMKAVAEINETYKTLSEEIGILKNAQDNLADFDAALKGNQELQAQYEAVSLVFGKGEKAKRLALQRTTEMYEKQQTKMDKVKNKLQKNMTKLLDKENQKQMRAENKKLKQEAKAALKKANFRKKDLRQYIKMQENLEKYQAHAARTKEGGFTKAEQMGATKAVKRQGSKLGGFATQAGLNKDLVKYAKLMNKHETIKQKATRYFMKIGKGIWGVLKTVGKVMMIALKFSMYFMLFILGAFLIFSVIREIFKKAEVMEVIMDTLKGVFEGVFDILSGVFDIFGAFFGGGTFGERLEKLLGGFGKIFGGLGKIIFSVMKGIVKMGVQLLVAAIGLVIDIAIAVIKGFPSFIMQTLPKVYRKIKEFIFSLPSKLYDKMVQIKDSIQEYLTKQVKKITDKLPSAGKVKSKAKEFGGKVKDFFGLHTGGFTKGGFNLVGERGPEIVRLPLGSRVFSNDNSKSMIGRGNTNNITINVNGRLGASDSELRDIAKKIGSMVSTEINRTTSSSTNVRF